MYKLNRVRSMELLHVLSDQRICVRLWLNRRLFLMLLFCLSLVMDRFRLLCLVFLLIWGCLFPIDSKMPFSLSECPGKSRAFFIILLYSGK